MTLNFFSLSIFRLILGLLFISTSIAHAENYYEKSYVLVIGINNYESSHWKDLRYAVNDAQGIALYLKSQEFEVTFLKNQEAIKNRIIFELQNNIAPKVEEDDRVLVFFAGHGFTEGLGEEEQFGYIVPYDGKNNSSTFISMEKLQELSRKMGKAKHQLFIMDACYGGLLAFASRSGAVKESHPHYLREVTRRKARLVLTAGGANEVVLDGGPNGHSVFTGYLLAGLEKSMADLNGDGWITFSELVGNVIPLASNRYQTPQGAVLPGHGGGEFVFRASIESKVILKEQQELTEKTHQIERSKIDKQSIEKEETTKASDSTRIQPTKKNKDSPLNFQEEIRLSVKTAIAALSGEMGSSRVNGIKGLLPSLPDNLTAKEITGILGNESTSSRGNGLRLLVTKTNHSSLAPDDIPKLLGPTSGSTRIACIEIVASYIMPPIPGLVAAEILKSQTGSYRVRALQPIATLIKRPLSEQEIGAILKETSGSSRSDALKLLLGKSPSDLISEQKNSKMGEDTNNLNHSELAASDSDLPKQGSVPNPDSTSTSLPPVCIPKSKLEQIYEASKRIFYTNQRDKAYSDIALDAICGGHFDLALEIAENIYYASTRDSIYVDLIEGALAQGNTSLANKISDLIYYKSTADNAKLRILEHGLN